MLFRSFAVHITLYASMSAWRRQALQLLPAHRALIEAAESPMALWIDLRLRFEDAFDAADDRTVRAMLSYAAWCVSPAAGPLPSDASTAAVCAFYEHVPQNRKYWSKMREWFTPTEFAELQGPFRYFLSETEMQELNDAYHRPRRV